MSSLRLVSPHAVQFYESEDFLSSAVGNFLAAGIEAGEPIIVIATEPHRDAFVADLERRGVSWEPSRVRLLDAREMLDRFMDGGLPDEQLFKQHIGGAIDELTSHTGRIRAYGEMVDLLWRDGNREGAIRLEELWNDLATTHSFSLLCAYPIGNFYKDADSNQFDEICERHNHVAPAESYPRAAEEDSSRLQEIARLQQRAQALKAEVEHRKDLEIALRDALAARRRAEEANAFLLDATSVLNSDLDYEARLRDVTNLAVPRLADFCAVDVIAEDGSEESYCSTDERDDVVTAEMSDAHAEVVRTGQTYVGGNGSWAVVPMQAGGRTLGAITLASNHFRYSQSNNDIALARDFASRAAIAVDNARHYRAAQDANRAKDQFLATLSHELRTPLTAILGWSRMLQLGDLDPETVRTAYETMERSATAQARIIDDLLDLSRVVTGKLKMKSELVDLAGIVENTGQTLRLAAEAKGVHIDVQPAAGAASRLVVMGDPTRLQQIAWNLLSNAIKFSEHGGRVAIGVERDEDTARIVVSDNGRGISPEFLPHVFEPFRQADGASTRSYSGLGLGLAIVKYLSEAHGGTVTGSSEGEGHGATFVVTLPLATRRSHAESSPQHDVVDLSNTTVLLVDDDTDTRNLVTAILKRCGAEVHAADSVATACEMLTQCQPTIVLSDIAMPGQDGYALVGHIRSAADAVCRLPVIALTASGDPKSEEKLRESGFDAYVSKPVDPLHLVRVIFDLHAMSSRA